MEINDRIAALRVLMKERGISIYIIPTADDHASEYVGEHFKSRTFMTGFTGSAGTAVVTMDEAGLWADGRYFVQAARQIEGTDWVLYRMAEPGVPKVTEYVEQHLAAGGCIGFDGATMTAADSEKYHAIAEKKGATLYTSEDLVDLIWEDRPEISHKSVWILSMQYAGKSCEDKLAEIRATIEEQDCDLHIVSSLYDIAWMTNLRGDDISHVPVFMSFFVMFQGQNYLYCFWDALSEEVLAYLAEQGISVRDYDAIYADVAEFAAEAKGAFVDQSVISAKLLDALGSVRIVDEMNPAEYARSIKNDTEIANTIEAHIHDGVAVTKFIHYIKQNVATQPITELSAAEELLHLREEQPGFLDVSFDTIAAYGANAAMMHYSATEEQYSDLEPEGFLLVDSGGHYLEGTTDITRTIVCGPITDRQKEIYTHVLQGNLRLAHAKFPHGVVGPNLDALCREPMWEMGLDYRCGTGHGVGHILNVHEGPNAFRWRLDDKKSLTPLVSGMITTDEPGYYEEGAYGIRIENELLCVKAEQTEYGQFYEFQPLTFAPIDLDAVLPELLSVEERTWLNEYHSQVFEYISPYLDDEEKEWLAYETRAI